MDRAAQSQKITASELNENHERIEPGKSQENDPTENSYIFSLPLYPFLALFILWLSMISAGIIALAGLVNPDVISEFFPAEPTTAVETKPATREISLEVIGLLAACGTGAWLITWSLKNLALTAAEEPTTAPDNIARFKKIVRETQQERGLINYTINLQRQLPSRGIEVWGRRGIGETRFPGSVRNSLRNLRFNNVPMKFWTILIELDYLAGILFLYKSLQASTAELIAYGSSIARLASNTNFTNLKRAGGEANKACANKIGTERTSKGASPGEELWRESNSHPCQPRVSPSVYKPLSWSYPKRQTLQKRKTVPLSPLRVPTKATASVKAIPEFSPLAHQEATLAEIMDIRKYRSLNSLLSEC